MEDEIDECIRKRIQWPQLPRNLKKLLSDSPKEYERYIFEFSIKNQLRFKGSLVRTVRKDERKYYEALVQNSIQKLMLYPYHLADMIVKGLRITPFIYYIEVVALLIELEKSYDTLPNFTAADCLRLLGIGRNEYLELIAKARSLKRRGRSKAIRGLLPRVPLNIPMKPWWRVELGYVLEEDVKPLCESEKALIDLLIDRGSQTAGTLDYNTVKTLYRRGLIYLDVPITSADKVSVPPLKGFVMNRVAGDYFETLLYKVFVSIDEHTSVADLATVLQVDCELVKQAVSLYCRLGFAHSLQPPPHTQHPSWRDAITTHTHQPYRQIAPLTFEQGAEEVLQMEPVLIKDEPSTSTQMTRHDSEDTPTNGNGQRVAVLFDSTLAAYLMMGNLSPDLKSHAVTLFEVGKLCDESLDSLLMELDKVAADPEIEGEARRYLTAAACLRTALRSLRPRMRPLDLLRCEALHALDAPARDRLLSTKYRLGISFAPLGREARAGLAARSLAHVGPAPPEAASPWMRLYLYHVAGYGPPSLLLTKGTVLRVVPRALLGFSRLAVWWWGAEGEWTALPAAAALAAANQALRRAPVLLQAAAVRARAPPPAYLAFPPPRDKRESPWRRHPGLRRLARRLRLARSAGYVTLLDVGVPDLGTARPPTDVQLVPPRKKKDICGVAKPVSELTNSSESEKTETNARLQSETISRPQSENSAKLQSETTRLQSETSAKLQSETTRHQSEISVELQSETTRHQSETSDKLQSETSRLQSETSTKLQSETTRLQSPIESHFAVTPTTDSTNASPANGFTSVEGGQLLCEELDNLDTRRSEESIVSEEFERVCPEESLSVSKESIADELEKIIGEENGRNLSELLSPAEESVSVFSRLHGAEDSGVDTAHTGSDDEGCKPERWTILELHFGIPLFDEELCEQVCSSIVDNVAMPEVLTQIKEDNEFIRADVLKFVSQCQYYPGEDMGIVKRGTLVPLPRRNLVFENGHISEWNGK